jgi:hypothetical protein
MRRLWQIGLIPVFVNDLQAYQVLFLKFGEAFLSCFAPKVVHFLLCGEFVFDEKVAQGKEF